MSPELDDFGEVLSMLAEDMEMTSREFRSAYKIRLVNTASGARGFARAKNRSKTEVEPFSDCNYGSVVEIQGIYFIAFYPDVWRTGHDFYATAAHELLHIVNPSWSEREIRKEEKKFCNDYEIETSNLLKSR